MSHRCSCIQGVRKLSDVEKEEKIRKKKKKVLIANYATKK